MILSSGHGGKKLNSSDDRTGFLVAAAAEQGAEAPDNDTNNAKDDEPHALVRRCAGYNFLGSGSEGTVSIDSENQKDDSGDENGEGGGSIHDGMGLSEVMFTDPGLGLLVRYFRNYAMGLLPVMTRTRIMISAATSST